MPDEIKDDAVKEDQVAAATEGDDGEEAVAFDEPPEESDDDGWTEEDMRLLSDEERAALFDDDDNGEEDTDAADAGEDTDAAADAAAGDDAAADDAGNSDADDDAAANPEPGPEIVGTETVDIAAIDERIEALDKAKLDAFDAWEDGEMTRDEYLAKLEEVDKETRDAVSEKAVAVDKGQEVYRSFINTAKGYFSENPDLATEDHAQDYDRHVRSVTASPKFQHLTHRQMLEAAHKLYVAEADALGIKVPALKSAKPKAADPVVAEEPKKAEPAKPKKRAGDQAPVTLAKMPVAQSVAVSDGKYSALAQRLENASAEEYEKILGSMSPDEAEAFASMDV